MFTPNYSHFLRPTFFNSKQICHYIIKAQYFDLWSYLYLSKCIFVFIVVIHICNKCGWALEDLWLKIWSHLGPTRRQHKGCVGKNPAWSFIVGFRSFILSAPIFNTSVQLRPPSTNQEPSPGLRQNKIWPFHSAQKSGTAYFNLIYHCRALSFRICYVLHISHVKWWFEEEEEESKQVDQMEEIKEGFPQLLDTKALFTADQRLPCSDRYFVKEAMTQLTERLTPEKIMFFSSTLKTEKLAWYEIKIDLDVDEK